MGLDIGNGNKLYIIFYAGGLSAMEQSVKVQAQTVMRLIPNFKLQVTAQKIQNVHM